MGEGIETDWPSKDSVASTADEEPQAEADSTALSDEVPMIESQSESTDLDEKPETPHPTNSAASEP